MKIWFLMSEEARKKLRALMPASWRPPKEDDKVEGKLEDAEEIDKIIRKPPLSRRALGD